MGCNCRSAGNTYIPTTNRANPRVAAETLCQQIAKAKTALPIKVTASGEILLPSATMPAHATLSAQGCRGTDTERILSIELKLTSLFNNATVKKEFLTRLGPNPTVGSTEALLKVF
jgi:hypothetical protein